MGIDLDAEFRPNTRNKPWGPFIRDDYVVMPITYRSVITAGIILGLTCLFALSAAYIASRQTKAARRPWRSVYIWMIWLEIIASLVIGIECMLYLLKIIRPSFWFYMSICKNLKAQSRRYIS
jgi:ABC-type spermidine/putrescine transport system permease subunit I